jgi:hypothetical protein
MARPHTHSQFVPLLRKQVKPALIPAISRFFWHDPDAGFGAAKVRSMPRQVRPSIYAHA